MKIDVKTDFSGLKKLQKTLGVALETRVGILTSTNSRTDTNGGVIDNANLGMTHEFGSISKKIPPRSFLRMPIEQNSDKIKSMVMKKASIIEKDMVNGNGEVLFEILGLAGENIVQSAFETGGFGQWAKNKPATINKKGSSSPLIDTGQLREAVISKVVNK